MATIVEKRESNLTVKRNMAKMELKASDAVASTTYISPLKVWEQQERGGLHHRVTASFIFANGTSTTR